MSEENIIPQEELVIPENIVVDCSRAIIALQRAIGYAKNMQNREARDSLEAAIDLAYSYISHASSCFAELKRIEEGEFPDNSNSPTMEEIGQEGYF